MVSAAIAAMTGAGLGFYVKGQLLFPLSHLGLGTEPSPSKHIELFPAPKDAVPAQTLPARPDPAVVVEPSPKFTEPTPAEALESPLDHQEPPNRPESQPSMESEALAQDPTPVPTPWFPDEEVSPAPSLPTGQDALDHPRNSPLSPPSPSTPPDGEALPLSPTLPEPN
jgi:hypothetical protein